MSFGYDASFAHFYPVSGPKNIPVGTTIDDHSAALLLALGNLRGSTDTPADRPVVFVAHSLGGLVCANALSRQHGPNDANVSLVNHTAGVIFLGTPFEGSEKARWGNRALQLLQLVSATNNEKMKVLEERSQKLAGINADFYKLLKKRDQSANHLNVACFFEVYPTYVARKDIGLIVPKDSATLSGIDPIPIEASHTGMCRFVDEHRNGYKSISSTLTEWIRRLGEKPSANDGQYSVYLGETTYHGAVTNNSGVVMGNAYTPAENGIAITGSKQINYYGQGWNSTKGED